ncbi:MAG: hypothetical protein WAK90_02590, partial [Pseudolabrys sp.]
MNRDVRQQLASTATSYGYNSPHFHAKMGITMTIPTMIPNILSFVTRLVSVSASIVALAEKLYLCLGTAQQTKIPALSILERRDL